MSDPPGPFALVSPLAQAQDVSSNPAFLWEESSDAVHYHLEVDDHPAFDSPEIEAITSFTFFTHFGIPLDGCTTYHWRVTASNGVEDTRASGTLATFTTSGCTQRCPGDCDNSGAVDFSDLIAMLFEFGTPDSDESCDTNASGVVDFTDLVDALFLFGPCP